MYDLDREYCQLGPQRIGLAKHPKLAWRLRSGTSDACSLEYAVYSILSSKLGSN